MLPGDGIPAGTLQANKCAHAYFGQPGELALLHSEKRAGGNKLARLRQDPHL